jgi:HEAT repeat protein
MRRHVLGIASFLLALASPVASNTAWAHGGRYTGPAGEVPPDSRTPGDPPPPDTGGNTQTPPDPATPGTPTEPPTGGTPTGPEGGTPDNPGGGGETPTGPGSGPGGVKSGSGRTARKATSFDSWRFWWHSNKDRFLDLRGRGAAGASTGGIGQVAEGGDNGFEAQGVTAKTVDSRVVPLLKRIARDRGVNFDIQASAVLGLARIGRREELPLLMEIARNQGAEQQHKVVQETAALSLGVMQARTPEVRRFLADLASDGTIPTRTRCFAAIALGLLADPVAPGSDPESLKSLLDLASAPAADREIQVAALVGIGLLGDPAAVPVLLPWLREEKAGGASLDDLRLSFVAAALGKIGRPGVFDVENREVVNALRVRLTRRERLTRYSSIIALGQIGERGGPEAAADCAAALVDVARAEGRGVLDAASTNFALVGLGRIAGVMPGADGRGGCPQQVRLRAMEALLRAFESRSSGTRSFAALGLGLAGKDLTEIDRAAVADRIRETFARMHGDVEERGALVAALGLLRDAKASGALRAILQDAGEDRALRGIAAVSLGLVGDRDSVAAIREVLEDRADRALRMDAAVALGILRDSRAVPILVDVLKNPKSSQFVLGSAAVALGRIGDQRAVDPLAGVLEDGTYADLTRALACVALGQIGDREDLPVLTRVSEDVNYRAYTDALGELLTIL